VRGVVGRDVMLTEREPERGVIGEGIVETDAVVADEDGRGMEEMDALDDAGLDCEDDSLNGMVRL
jgi:hypothetical protein